MGEMNLLTAARTDKLWHEMRADLEAVSGPVEADRLRCCVCGRLLQRSAFSLEHIVPRQALADDPQFVKASLSASMRSGHILLCSAPLTVKGRRTQGNGCNGWKGSFYDASLRALMNRSVFRGKGKLTERVSVAAFSVGYLAMVARFGYKVAFTPAGILARRQFFAPDRFLRDIPAMSQMVLGGDAPAPSAENMPFWSDPFRFEVRGDVCHVVVRNFSVTLPISRDPQLPVVRHLRFAPQRYLLRPDFSSVLD